ncbi:Coenzyme F420 hydrogenase/dehydrogenase, beta subunit C-terminal domain [Methanobrevibacter sp. DSM 116169]|uniref:Coenzyme F420 hydrogenase/dehydrogenase, beta subunit C-terminal domain n=1 Tax=Methanobrevibacter sp. DSM 116169 TaxID=3242727 RepID=UPI0038FCE848
MSSEYLLLRAKNDELIENSACGGAVTSILKYLLDEEEVDGVLTLKKGDDIYDGVPVFIEDSEEIMNTCGSLHCAPTMFGGLISKYLKNQKIGVVAKPCDAMAIDELKKRNQIDEDNIYTIGLNCGGTVMPATAQKMFELFYEVNPDDVVKEEIDKGQIIIELKDGTEKGIKIDDLEEEGYGRRENCQKCELKIPRNTDLVCGNWGSEDDWTFVEINTEKGKTLVDKALKKGYLESKNPSEDLIGRRSKLENIMIKLAKKFQKNYLENNYPETDKWDEYWNRCIGCYGCRDACPLCWCKECDLEKEFYKDVNPDISPDPLTFQGIRLSHMSFSCVNCGQCSDVCPMEIPVARMYDKMQKIYREKNGYIAGVSEEKPPIFVPDEE